MAQDVEEAGNRGERLDPESIVAVLRDHGLEVVRSERYAMYYRHEPGRAVRAPSGRTRCASPGPASARPTASVADSATS